MIGSRFEVDASKAMCRLAFYGRLVALIDAADPQQIRKLRIFKVKQRTGSIDRVNKDGLSAVCKGMFKKETDISVFVGLKVSHLSTPSDAPEWLQEGYSCMRLACQSCHQYRRLISGSQSLANAISTCTQPALMPCSRALHHRCDPKGDSNLVRRRSSPRQATLGPSMAPLENLANSRSPSRLP